MTKRYTGPALLPLFVTFLLITACTANAADGGLASQPYQPCGAAGPDAGKMVKEGEDLGAARCAALTAMANEADPAVASPFRNAAGLCRVTYQEGFRHLSNICGVEALMASHVRYLGNLLRQPVGNEQIEALARAEQVGIESDIQMNTARKVTANVLAFHHALATNLDSEGVIRIGSICRGFPRIRARVEAFAKLSESDRHDPMNQEQVRNDHSLAKALVHCDAALSELREAEYMNGMLKAAFDQGAARHQVSADRAKQIQTDAGQIGILLQGVAPASGDSPNFQRELLAQSRKEPACSGKITGLSCAKLIENRDFVRKVSRLPGGTMDRLSAEVLDLAQKELSAYGTDPTRAGDDFEKWAGFPLETAVQLLPKVSDAKDDEALTALFKAELKKNLRTDYVNDMIAAFAGASKFGILVTVTGQGVLEAAHDHVIDHDGFTFGAVVAGMAKNATGIAGPLWGPVGDGVVDFVVTGSIKQGIAAYAGGMAFEGGKWALETYAPSLAAGVTTLQPYVVGGYYAYKAAQYGVFRLGQSEIEWGLPAGVKLEQSNYDYVQDKYHEQGVTLDPRRSYVGIWMRLTALAHHG